MNIISILSNENKHLAHVITLGCLSGIRVQKQGQNVIKFASLALS